MLMILPIIILLSIAEAIAASCTESASIFTLELRDEIINALNEGIDASSMQQLQCAEVESK